MPIARRYLQRDDKPEHNLPQSQQSGVQAQRYDPVNTHTEPHRVVGAEEVEKKENDIRMENGWENGRQELIKRIKKEQRPSWLQETKATSHNPPAHHDEPQQLLPSPELSKDFKRTYANVNKDLEPASSIARPRSALHSGDFRDPSPETSSSEIKDILSPLSHHSKSEWLGSPPSTSWYTSPKQRPALAIPKEDNPHFQLPTTPLSRNRAASYSAESSSFVFVPPTSPLAVQSNSADLNGHDEHGSRRSRSPDKSSRRRTFSPRALRAMEQGVSSAGGHFRWHVPGLRQEKTFPYQAHQPRRSLSSFHNLNSSPAPQVPSARTRRPSISSDASPMQRAPMVGRYEESILRGRMSTVPSKPFDFVAQIGVMGKGKCRASLRCPPHITIPFPAVFYNYGSTRDRGGVSHDGPSPYVGMVDIENFEQNPNQDLPDTKGNFGHIGEDDSDNNNAQQSAQALSKRTRTRGQSSTKRPPGGSYRIPQQGQIQVIIKNPNKTAVKLFLVPYDLTAMEPGQKTFIRQRSYSAGPIIEMPISSRKNLGTDRPEAAISNSDDPNDRPVLRYLIHLQICCPSKGRFYLYKSMRIVFANRVPDGKEKLRHETQLPDPRFSTYKPEKSSNNMSRRSSDVLPVNELKMSDIRMSSSRQSAAGPFGANLFSFDETKHVPTGPAGPMSGSLRSIVSHMSVDHNGYAHSMCESVPERHQSGADVVMQEAASLSTLPMDSFAKFDDQLVAATSPSAVPQHVFERRDREAYSSSSNGSANQSPRAEGLIAQQFRDWAERRDS